MYKLPPFPSEIIPIKTAALQIELLIWNFPTPHTLKSDYFAQPAGQTTMEDVYSDNDN